MQYRRTGSLEQHLQKRRLREHGEDESAWKKGRIRERPIALFTQPTQQWAFSLSSLVLFEELSCS